MKNISFYIVLIILGSADLFFCIWMTSHFREMTYLPLVFVLSKIVFAVLVFLLIKPRMKRAAQGLDIVGFFVFTLVITFSLFGVITLIIIMESSFGEKIKKAKIYHIDQEEGELVPDEIDEHDSVPLRELTKVAPLVDGLTDDEKKNRIATIQAMDHMIDFPSIRESLISAKSDPHKEVQYYVNDVLKKVTEKCMGQIKNQLDIINNAEPTYESYKKLADLYAYIANASIDHPVLVDFYHQESAKYYAYLLENYPESKVEVLKQLIPAVYQNKEYDECLKLCEQVKGIGELNSIAMLFKLRSLFKLRKVALLKEEASSVNLRGIVPQGNLFLTQNEANG